MQTGYIDRQGKELPFKNIVLFGLICFIIGSSGAGITAGYVSRGQSAGEIACLNQRYDNLNREYTERQRIIEEQQRSIRTSVTECIEYAENAGRIIERTGENTRGAITNLREAVALIGQGIEERKNLEVELHRLRSSLFRIRDVVGLEIE